MEPSVGLAACDNMSTSFDKIEPVVVMVVEDDLIARMSAIEALTDAGLVALEAQSGDAALDRLSDGVADDVDVVFTDIHMPGSLNGLQLARDVRARWPRIGLLVASGQEQPSAAEMPQGSRFLSKPYRQDHLLRIVRELVPDR